MHSHPPMVEEQKPRNMKKQTQSEQVNNIRQA